MNIPLFLVGNKSDQQFAPDHDRVLRSVMEMRDENVIEVSNFETKL